MCRVVDESEVQTTQPDESGNMYMLVQENLSWENARDACQNAGGQLAEVRSASEEDQIKELLGGMGVTQAWLCNEVQNGADHDWGDYSYTLGTYSNWGSDVQLGREGADTHDVRNDDEDTAGDAGFRRKTDLERELSGVVVHTWSFIICFESGVVFHCIND